MKALMIMSLLTVALTTAALAKPGNGYQYPNYPEWASQAFEPRH